MPENDENDSQKENADKPWWAEAIKEISLTGLATVFMTEDSIRNYLKEKKLPKELAAILLDSVGKKKDDFYALLAKEFGKVLSKTNLTEEWAKFLQNNKVHINATLTFEKKDNA